MRQGNVNDSAPTIAELEDELRSVEGRGRVDLLNRLAGLHWSRDLDRVGEFAGEALQVAEDLDYPEGCVRALLSFGVRHWFRGEYADAEGYYLQALEFPRSAVKVSTTVAVRSNLGLIHMVQGRLDEALTGFFDALKTIEESGEDLDPRDTLNNLAVVLGRLGDVDKAVVHHERSLELSREAEDDKGEGTTLNNLAVLEMDRGNHLLAADHLSDAEGCLRRSGTRGELARCLCNMSEVRRSLGDGEDAIRLGREALEIFRDAEDRDGVVTALVNIGAAQTQVGRAEDGRQTLEKALRAATDLEDPDEIRRCRLALAESRAAAGAFEDAYRHQVEATRLAAEILTREKARFAADAERRYQAEIHQLRNVELEKALKEIRTLSGLLPICSSCKKIRDDKGYWTQLEDYLGSRTGAKFSHGICPDCALEIYPDHYRPDGA